MAHGARLGAEEHAGAAEQHKDPVKHQATGLGEEQQLDVETDEGNGSRGKGERGQEVVRFSLRLLEAAQRQGGDHDASQSEGGQRQPRGSHEDTPRRARGRSTATFRSKNPKPSIEIQEEQPADTRNEEGLQTLDERRDQGKDVSHGNGGLTHPGSAELTAGGEREHPLAGGTTDTSLEGPPNGAEDGLAADGQEERLTPAQEGGSEGEGADLTRHNLWHPPAPGVEVPCCCEYLGSQDGPYFGGTCRQCQHALDLIRQEESFDLPDIHRQIRRWLPFQWFVSMCVGHCVQEYDMELDVGETIADFVNPWDFLVTNGLTLEDIQGPQTEVPVQPAATPRPTSAPREQPKPPMMERGPPMPRAQQELMESIREGQLYLVRELRTRDTEWTQMQRDLKQMAAAHTEQVDRFQDRFHQLERELETARKDVAILKGQRDRLEAQVKDLIAHQKGQDHQVRELQHAVHQARFMMKHREEARTTSPLARPTTESGAGTHEDNSMQHHEDREEAPSPQPPPPPPRTSRAPKVQPQRKSPTTTQEEDKAVPPPRSVSPPPPPPRERRRTGGLQQARSTEGSTGEDRRPSTTSFQMRHVTFHAPRNFRAAGPAGVARFVQQMLANLSLTTTITTFSLIGFSMVELYFETKNAERVDRALTRVKTVQFARNSSYTFINGNRLERPVHRGQIVWRIASLLSTMDRQELRACALAELDKTQIKEILDRETEMRALATAAGRGAGAPRI